ncbi:hypothetical protein DFH09DRAFT_1333227 [Mycena vulgaris]|nr:hypothetical protein DFH09DRAFT_1333227 [Mycena vulgaris]
MLEAPTLTLETGNPDLADFPNEHLVSQAIPTRSRPLNRAGARQEGEPDAGPTGDHSLNYCLWFAEVHRQAAEGLAAGIGMDLERTSLIPTSTVCEEDVLGQCNGTNLVHELQRLEIALVQRYEDYARSSVASEYVVPSIHRHYGPLNDRNPHEEHDTDWQTPTELRLPIPPLGGACTHVLGYLDTLLALWKRRTFFLSQVKIVRNI